MAADDFECGPNLKADWLSLILVCNIARLS